MTSLSDRGIGANVLRPGEPAKTPCKSSVTRRSLAGSNMNQSSRCVPGAYQSNSTLHLPLMSRASPITSACCHVPSSMSTSVRAWSTGW